MCLQSLLEGCNNSHAQKLLFARVLKHKIMVLCFVFHNVSIAIGSDEMIRKECTFVYFSIRLLEISTLSVP